jgi:pimeloyl-ACP methyl ester carboxylesterase
MNPSPPVKYPFKVHHAILGDGVNIAYCDEGKSDEVILFIHGLANYLGSWSHQVKVLQKHFRCIAIDLPGNGLSSKNDMEWSISGYAAHVVRFIQYLGLKHVTLCGHSMGGQIAAHLALDQPGLVSKLILVAPAGVEHYKAHEKLMMHGALSIGSMVMPDEQQIDKTIRQSFLHAGPEAEAMIKDLVALMESYPPGKWNEMSQGSVHAILNEPVGERLAGLRCPVLMIIGDEDVMVPNRVIHFNQSPESLVTDAVAQIPEAKGVVIKHAGHFVQIEQHHFVNEDILAFMK